MIDAYRSGIWFFFVGCCVISSNTFCMHKKFFKKEVLVIALNRLYTDKNKLTKKEKSWYRKFNFKKSYRKALLNWQKEQKSMRVTDRGRTKFW